MNCSEINQMRARVFLLNRILRSHCTSETVSRTLRERERERAKPRIERSSMQILHEATDLSSRMCYQFCIFDIALNFVYNQFELVRAVRAGKLDDTLAQRTSLQVCH